jgi:hypothetical protein
VLTISDDRKTDEVRKIVARLETSLPVLMDKGSNTVNAYRVRLLPTLYLIDKEQRVYKAWTGPAEDKEAEVIESIKSLLGTDGPSNQD